MVAPVIFFIIILVTSIAGILFLPPVYEPLSKAINHLQNPEEFQRELEQQALEQGDSFLDKLLPEGENLGISEKVDEGIDIAEDYAEDTINDADIDPENLPTGTTTEELQNVRKPAFDMLRSFKNMFAAGHQVLVALADAATEKNLNRTVISIISAFAIFFMIWKIFKPTIKHLAIFGAVLMIVVFGVFVYDITLG